MAWDFGGAFAQGYEIGDRMSQRARQRRMDEAAIAERAYQRNKDASTASRQALEDQFKREQIDAEIADRMSKRAREEKALPSEIDLRRAQAYRLMNPVEKPTSEQAVGAKLKEIGSSIADIDTKEEGMRKWYLPSFLEDKLDPAEAALREELKSRRMGLLGMSGGDRMSSPPPAKKSPSKSGGWRKYTR